jgi:tetratricopeptide (TPR) repeat protein
MTLAGVTRSLHSYNAILPLLDRGKELAVRLGDDDLLLNLDWAEWSAAATACDFPRADPIAERFRTMAEQAAPDDVVELTLGHGVWGIHSWHHGRIDEAVAHLDRSRAAAVNLPAAHMVLGMVAEQRMLTELFSVFVHDLAGDLDEVGLAYERLVQSQDDRVALAMVAGLETAAAMVVGDMPRAIRASGDGLAADPDDAFGFSGTLNQMYAASAALAGGGDPDAAIAMFEEGHVRYQRSRNRTGLGSAYATMAIELTRAGALDRAKGYLTRAQDELRTRGERWPEPVILLAEAELQSAEGGSVPVIRELLERARDVAAQQGSHAIARRMERALHALGGR